MAASQDRNRTGAASAGASTARGDGRRLPQAGDGHADPGAATGLHRPAGVSGRGRADQRDEQGEQGGETSHPASVAPTGRRVPGSIRPTLAAGPQAGIMRP